MDMNARSANDQWCFHGLQIVMSMFGAFYREVPFPTKWREWRCSKHQMVLHWFSKPVLR